MASHKARLLVVVLVFAALLRAPFLFSRHREGDERDTRALVAQLSRGKYTLRDAPEINRATRRAAYVEAPLYHHPPFYYGLGWLFTRLLGEAGLYLLTYVAALLVVGLVFATGALLRDPTTGLVAALISLLCPTTQLVSGKIWAEALLSALLMALVYTLYRAAQSSAAPARRQLALCFALGLAITSTRQTGVFALGFLAPLWVCVPEPRKLRPAVLAAAAGLVAGLLLWFAANALVTGSLVPAAAAAVDDLRGLTAFVVMLLTRNPWSFLYVPWLLCPLYLCGLGLMRPSARALLPLPIFVLGYAGGLTALAAIAGVSYHMKYMAPALPVLALAASLWLVPRLAQRRWPAGVLALLALCYAGPMLYTLSIELPAMAEVDPRFFYRAFDVLPW